MREASDTSLGSAARSFLVSMSVIRSQGTESWPQRCTMCAPDARALSSCACGRARAQEGFGESVKHAPGGIQKKDPGRGETETITQHRLLSAGDVASPTTRQVRNAAARTRATRLDHLADPARLARDVTVVDAELGAHRDELAPVPRERARERHHDLRLRAPRRANVGVERRYESYATGEEEEKTLTCETIFVSAARSAESATITSGALASSPLIASSFDAERPAIAHEIESPYCLDAYCAARRPVKPVAPKMTRSYFFTPPTLIVVEQ